MHATVKYTTGGPCDQADSYTTSVYMSCARRIVTLRLHYRLGCPLLKQRPMLEKPGARIQPWRDFGKGANPIVATYSFNTFFVCMRASGFSSVVGSASMHTAADGKKQSQRGLLRQCVLFCVQNILFFSHCIAGSCSCARLSIEQFYFFRSG